MHRAMTTRQSTRTQGNRGRASLSPPPGDGGGVSPNILLDEREPQRLAEEEDEEEEVDEEEQVEEEEDDDDEELAVAARNLQEEEEEDGKDDDDDDEEGDEERSISESDSWVAFREQFEAKRKAIKERTKRRKEEEAMDSDASASPTPKKKKKNGNGGGKGIKAKATSSGGGDGRVSATSITSELSGSGASQGDKKRIQFRKSKQSHRFWYTVLCISKPPFPSAEYTTHLPTHQQRLSIRFHSSDDPSTYTHPSTVTVLGRAPEYKEFANNGGGKVGGGGEVEDFQDEGYDWVQWGPVLQRHKERLEECRQGIVRGVRFYAPEYEDNVNLLTTDHLHKYLGFLWVDKPNKEGSANFHDDREIVVVNSDGKAERKKMVLHVGEYIKECIQFDGTMATATGVGTVSVAATGFHHGPTHPLLFPPTHSVQKDGEEAVLELHYQREAAILAANHLHTLRVDWFRTM